MIETSTNKGIITVHVKNSNRITASTADEIKTELNSIIVKAELGTKVVFDLAGIKFIDSTGIGVLISALKTAKEKDSLFVLSSIQDGVLSLLQLMKLDKVFEIA